MFRVNNETAHSLFQKCILTSPKVHTLFTKSEYSLCQKCTLTLPKVHTHFARSPWGVMELETKYLLLTPAPISISPPSDDEGARHAAVVKELGYVPFKCKGTAVTL